MTTNIGTGNGAYSAVTGEAGEVAEKSVETFFKQNFATFTEQANLLTGITTVDLIEPTARYFEYVQQSVDFSRELATKWAEIITSFSGTVRGQAEQVSSLVQGQTTVVADLVVSQAEKAQDFANEQAALSAEAKKEQESADQAAEQAATKHPQERGRAPYEGLTKAELADILEERDLPTSGTVDELIERLVVADTK